MSKKLVIGLLFLTIFQRLWAQEYQSADSVRMASVKLLDNDCSSQLYKAGISVYGHYFSGLYLLKKQPADTSYRVVMLSEFGLSYFDFTYKNQSLKLESVQEFLNKPLLIKLLQNDIKLWFNTIDCSSEVKEFKPKSPYVHAYKFKYKSDKYYYFYDQNKQLSLIKKKEGWFGKAIINIGSYENGIPKTLEIKHKRGKITTNLTLLKKE